MTESVAPNQAPELPTQQNKKHSKKPRKDIAANSTERPTKKARESVQNQSPPDADELWDNVPI